MRNISRGRRKFISSQYVCRSIKHIRLKLWIVSSEQQCLIKYNITTMQRHVYPIEEPMSVRLQFVFDLIFSYELFQNVSGIDVFDGIIWLYCRPNVLLVEVASTKCKVLTRIAMQSRWEKPDFVQVSKKAFNELTIDILHND